MRMYLSGIRRNVNGEEINKLINKFKALKEEARLKNDERSGEEDFLFFFTRN